MSSGYNPCITCGACCAHFRVSFYWAEADDVTPGGVPQELTEESPPFRRTMKGTNQRHNMRCVALAGRIGEKVGCSIYTSRPNPCRAFEASYEFGTQNKRCDEARHKFGLKPLRLEDWGNSSGE
jgi:Fe-S-cluster containining protein